MSFVIDAGIPAGTIFIWHGNQSDIPAGYTLCNGLKDTPDLTALTLVDGNAQNRFYVMRNNWESLPYKLMDSQRGHLIIDQDLTRAHSDGAFLPENDGLYVLQSVNTTLATTGKYYFEVATLVSFSSAVPCWGIAPLGFDFTVGSIAMGVGAFFYGCRGNGAIFADGVHQETDLARNGSARLGFLFDRDAGTLQIQMNGNSESHYISTIPIVDTTKDYHPVYQCGAGQNSDVRFYMEEADWLHGSAAYNEWRFE